MKHERLPSRWRLKKTTARQVSYRPIEDEDIRFAYAAYKKGALKDMAGPFADTGMSPEEFATQFIAAVQARYHGAWTLFAETRAGFKPAGMVFAFYSHPDHTLSPFMIIGDLVWFPWTTPRNRIEAAVYFFSLIRASVPLVDYAHGELNKRFFEMICQHGIMRRAGTTYNVVKGEPVAIYETRSPERAG